MLLRVWGSCGRVAVVDGEVAGYIIWAPPVHVPAADGFATGPVSADAVILTTAHVAAEHRGGGLGRMMVQGMAKDLIKRGGVRAVEAFGDTRGRTGRCVVPADFLLAVGFSTHRAHAVHPRMRMDLRTTLSIREELERGLETLLGAVSGKRARHPAPQRMSPHGPGPVTRQD
jgi:GNAT superfamily N-acetyltransferase